MIRLPLNHLSRETLRAGSAAFIDQAVISGTSFCLSVIIARTCSKEEFGLYVLGMSIIIFVTALQTALITTPYTFYSPRPDGRIDAQYAGSTLIQECGLSIVGVIGLVGTASMVSRGAGVPGLGRIVWTLAGAITFILLREYGRRTCFAWLQGGTAIVMDLCAAIIQIGGLVFLSRLGLLSASSAYWLTGSACGLTALWWLISERRNFDVRLSKLTSDLSRNWSFGKWIFVGGLVSMATSQLYPWFLADLHGAAATGRFAAWIGVVLFVNPFLIGFSNFLGPKAAHSFTNGGIVALRRVVYKTTVLISVGMVLFSLGMFIVGNKLVILIYGSQYAGGGAVVSALVLSVLAAAVALGFDAGLYAMNRPKTIFHANVLGLGATVSFGFWMAKYYGPLGAAYGLLATNVVTSATKCFSFSTFSDNLTDEASVPGLSRAEILGRQTAPMADTEAEG